MKQDQIHLRTPQELVQKYQILLSEADTLGGSMSSVKQRIAEINAILDGLTLDDVMSTTSNNPVKNKVITNAINTIDTRLSGDITSLSTRVSAAESSILTKATLVSPPASASSTGTAGQIAYDSDYFYVCTATNEWKRVAISTF